MLDMVEEGQEDRTTYPDEGVTVSINHHAETLGKHRVRFYFPREVANVLRRGLAYPRLHIDGSFVNGLRIWCTQQDGLAPILSKSGAWNVTLPVRRVRGREEQVISTPVAVEWERDETGPVLLIPRPPDKLLPEPVIEKLPNGAVDPETRGERADKRLERELAKLAKAEQEEGEMPEGTTFLDDIAEISRLKKAEEAEAFEPMGEPTHLANLEAIHNAPNAHERDLKEAIGMVNELVDRLGERVALAIDEHGHVTAKRRVVSFIDL